jgi:hypothetical protein
MSKWKVITDLGDFVVAAWTERDAARRVTLATFGRQRIVEIRRAS